MFQQIRNLSKRIYYGNHGMQVNTPRPRPPLITPRKLIRKSPLRALAPKIECIRQQIGNLLIANPDWKTHSDDRHDLHDEIFQELQKYTKAYPADKFRGVLSIQDLANLRFARELQMVLVEFESKFLKNYAIEPGKSLSESMQPAYATRLGYTIRSVFKHNSDKQRQLLASVMDHKMLQWAGIPMERDVIKRIELLREKHPAVLSLDEALAMFDYVDPYNAHFIIINGGARLKTFWGVDGFAEAGEVLSAPFHRALQKLRQNKYFTDCGGIYYKGFNAQQLEYQHDRLMLDYLAEKNGVMILPHPLSTSRFREKSFVRANDRTEDAEMVIHTACGIDVGLFHTQLGKQLGEVILLPEPLQIRKREVETLALSGRESAITAAWVKPLRYTARSMKGDASAEPRWRVRDQ